MEENRLKVEKNIIKKVMLFKLSFSYLLVFCAISLIPLIIVFVGGISIKKLLFFVVVEIALFMIIKWLDVSNYLESLNFTKMPHQIENDLYKLKNEKDCKIIGEPPYISS